MNYDFALVTLSEEASSATGYLAMFFPPNTTTKVVDITTAGYVPPSKRCKMHVEHFATCRLASGHSRVPMTAPAFGGVARHRAPADATPAHCVLAQSGNGQAAISLRCCNYRVSKKVRASDAAVGAPCAYIVST